LNSRRRVNSNVRLSMIPLYANRTKNVGVKYSGHEGQASMVERLNHLRIQAKAVLIPMFGVRMIPA
jgi:hypothetical protein